MSTRKHRPKLDKELTASKHFLDKRSYCDLLGRTFVYGADMAVLRDAVLERDKFRCVQCSFSGSFCISLEMDHIKSKGQGGDDSLENCRTLCRSCHTNRHLHIGTEGKVSK